MKIYKKTWDNGQVSWSKPLKKYKADKNDKAQSWATVWFPKELEPKIKSDYLYIDAAVRDIYQDENGKVTIQISRWNEVAFKDTPAYKEVYETCEYVTEAPKVEEKEVAVDTSDLPF